jgi:hypothetical protein
MIMVFVRLLHPCFVFLSRAPHLGYTTSSNIKTIKMPTCDIYRLLHYFILCLWHLSAAPLLYFMSVTFIGCSITLFYVCDIYRLLHYFILCLWHLSAAPLFYFMSVAFIGCSITLFYV